MFGSEILDTALAIVFVLTFITLFATAVQEMIEAGLRKRAKDLERGIKGLLGDDRPDDMLRRLYEHPLVSSLFPGSYKPGMRTLPTYIPAARFAGALLDILTEEGDASLRDALKGGDVQGAHAAIDRIKSDHLKRVLLHAYDHAKGDLDATRSYLEQWYDDSMDIVSGWYRQRAHKILFVIGFASAALFNIDLYHLGTGLQINNTLHESFAAYYEGAAPTLEENLLNVGQMQAQLLAIEAPIGWFPPPQQVCEDTAAGTSCHLPAWSIFTMLTGWVIVGFATTLGAPFWFDALNKVMVLRSTVKPREKSRPEGSEDRR